MELLATSRTVPLIYTTAVLQLVLVVLVVLPLDGCTALDNGAARTPPMGWGSWIQHHTNPTAAVLKQAADDMVSTGLAAAGYNLVMLDDGAPPPLPPPVSSLCVPCAASRSCRAPISTPKAKGPSPGGANLSPRCSSYIRPEPPQAPPRPPPARLGRLDLCAGWPTQGPGPACSGPGPRDADGRIIPDKIKFPGGMAAVADYIHAKGLQFAIYTAPHGMTCGCYTGSLGNEAVDAQTCVVCDAPGARWGRHHPVRGASDCVCV